MPGTERHVINALNVQSPKSREENDLTRGRGPKKAKFWGTIVIIPGPDSDAVSLDTELMR